MYLLQTSSSSLAATVIDKACAELDSVSVMKLESETFHRVRDILASDFFSSLTARAVKAKGTSAVWDHLRKARVFKSVLF